MDVGVIGVGAQGKRHARVYSELKGVDNVYVYDINTESAWSVAKKLGVIAVPDFNDIIKKSDAISVCVPTAYHYDISMCVITSGKHCLIEKPICDRIDDADALVEISKENGIISGVANIERFNPIVGEIKKIIENPLYMEFSRRNPSSGRMVGTNVVEDLMIHDIDIATYIDKTCELCLKLSSAVGNKDICTAIFDDTVNNLPIVLSASRKSAKKIRSIYIEQEDCTIEGDYMNQEVYIHKKPDVYEQKENAYVQENIVEKISVNKQEPLKVELMTFLDCIKSKRQFPVSLEDGLRNLKICKEILERCI
jgi:predicted dehydrogenase